MPELRQTFAIEAVGLCRTYGATRALDDLTLSVEAGQAVGFLGPNGAGKTTAIRILTTILRPTTGRFSVAGVGCERPDEIRRVIGVLPESSGYPDLQTGREFLRYHARLHGRSRTAATAAVRQLLNEVGLADHGELVISGYSRGMRQRLGIARALINEPAVVFLDEPTLGLDPAGQRDVLELIRRLTRDRGSTVVVSTHLLAEVEAVCSRAVILNRGRVVADGSVDEVARRAAAARTVRVRVGANHVAHALDVLRRAEPVVDAEARPQTVAGTITVTLVGGADPEDSATAVLRALIDAGVRTTGFDLDGGSLSDAFLTMTELT